MGIIKFGAWGCQFNPLLSHALLPFYLPSWNDATRTPSLDMSPRPWTSQVPELWEINLCSLYITQSLVFCDSSTVQTKTPFFMINLFNPTLGKRLFLTRQITLILLILSKVFACKWHKHLSVICLKLFKGHVYFLFQTKKGRVHVSSSFSVPLVHSTLLSTHRHCLWGGAHSSGGDSWGLIDTLGRFACSGWPGRKCSMNKRILVFYILWWMTIFLLS